MRRRDLLTLPLALPAQSTAARNLVLFTSDGLRWQDVFRGIDPKLMIASAAHMGEARHLRDRYWREAPDERRRALMPEFWTKLSAVASITSDVLVTNAYKVSYPGYSEIMTGKAQDDAIRGNDPKQNPSETIFEILKHKWNLAKEDVAVFASWDAFQWICEKVPGTITINAGYTDIGGSPRLEELSRMQHQIMTDDTSARHDWITFEIAMEYLRLRKPRVMYIALNETDEWAHRNRYDRYLEMVAYVDRCLGRLWDTLQAVPEYRANTAVVVTADHGRGENLGDWTSHGSAVEGAGRIWLAALGPNRPPADRLAKRQRDILQMCLRMVGAVN